MSSGVSNIKSQLLDYMERLESEVQALRCLSGLLNIHETGSDCIDLSELCYLLDPIIEREKGLVDEVRALLNPAA